MFFFRGIEKLDNTKNELIIKSVKKESKGDYYCVASNNYGNSLVDHLSSVKTVFKSSLFQGFQTNHSPQRVSIIS